MRYFRLILFFIVIGNAPRLWAGPENSLDLEAFKRDTRIFESIMSERLKQNFPNPFAITAQPIGAYLPGYGMALSFSLNINRATITWPWGELQAPRRVGGYRNKRDQISQLQATILGCLANYGHTIKQLSSRDRISVYVHVDDRNELDPTKNTTILVFTAKRSDIEAFTTQVITYEEFSRKVEVAEY
ncbi:MAG: hypothetical protein ACRD1R_17810 [Acidobacteriota bacterium]